MTGAAESTELISRGSQSLGLVLGGALFVALAVLTAFGIWSTVTLGGVEAGVWLLGGRHLYVQQPVIDVGAVRPGETITVEFSVQDLSGVPLTVLGARTDCSCAVASGLPLTLPPRTRQTMSVSLTPSPREAGAEFERQVELYSDHSEQSLFVFIRGTVLSAASTEPPAPAQRL
jgi:hypothetical protein